MIMIMAKTLRESIDELIGVEESYASQYKTFQESFSYSKIVTVTSKDELNEKYRTLSKLFSDIHETDRQLFKIFISANAQPEDRDKAGLYRGISGFILNSIQNLYLNPINYRLNQLNADETIKWGRRSIYFALVIAIFSMGFTFFGGINPTQHHCCSPVKVENVKYMDSNSCSIENSIDVNPQK